MILVTGATGFLGYHIVKLLHEMGKPVRVFVRDEDAARKRLGEFNGIEYAVGELFDVLAIEKALEGVEAVIHGAAVVSFWKKRFAEMKEVNVRGTANLVNMCLLQDPMPKFVHVSSIAALGKHPDSDIIDEKTSWNESKKNSRYSVSKHLAELEAQRGMIEGLPTVIVNPGVIIGPGDWSRNTPKLFKMIDNGLKWYRGGSTGFVGVGDVAKAIAELLESDFEKGERFILVAENLSYREFLSMVARKLDKRPPSRKAPRVVARSMGILNEFLASITGKEPLITKESTRFPSRPLRFNGDKIVGQTSFRYSSMESVIAETAEAFKAKQNGSPQ